MSFQTFEKIVQTVINHFIVHTRELEDFSLLAPHDESGQVAQGRQGGEEVLLLEQGQGLVCSVHNSCYEELGATVRSCPVAKSEPLSAVTLSKQSHKDLQPRLFSNILQSYSP